jgi:hypothetical protein
MTDLPKRPAFYDDGTGLCFWCPKPAVDEWCGVPLCADHYGVEMQQLMQDIGLPQ